jgi:cell division GTPase FtsZ
MTYLFVGAGQAGGAIVDDIFEYRKSTTFGLFGEKDIETVGSPLVFNSTVRDLQNLSNVSKENQYGVAAQEGIIKGTERGFEEQVTGGFGRDPVEADDVMSAHTGELRSLFTERFGGSGEGIQFAIVLLGLGGGTGCGIAPYIVQTIQEVTDETVGVIALGILPNTTGPIGDDELSAGRQAWNTVYGLDRLEDHADGIILVDNQRISYEAVVESQFNEYNEYVAAAIYDLIAGPVLSDVEVSALDLDTPDIDVQDIVTSLSFGKSIGESAEEDSKPGYASLGRSVTMTKSLSGYLFPFVGRKDIDSAALSRIATSKQTLANADSSLARKAIVLVRAPKRYFKKEKYKIKTSTIEGFFRGKSGLSEYNMGIAVGDRNLASVTTLITYDRDDIQRLDEIEETANQYEETETGAVTQ